MTRKRLVKLIMGCGYSRNTARLLAAGARSYPSYAEYWRCKRLEHGLHAAVQPAVRAVKAFASALKAVDWGALATAARKLTNAITQQEETTE